MDLCFPPAYFLMTRLSKAVMLYVQMIEMKSRDVKFTQAALRSQASLYSASSILEILHTPQP